jgi:adenine deaminase
LAEQGRCLLPAAPIAISNNFHAQPLQASALATSTSSLLVPVIECFDGQLITARRNLSLPLANGCSQPDLAQDVLKLVVLNRYTPGAAPAVAFIKGFGLTQGALASSVGHDSHNITAVGCDDESLARAINLVVAAQGGLAAVSANGAEQALALPVAGLMSDRPGPEVAATYSALDEFAKAQLGSGLQAPFMTLSFMALLVIPSLKLSDKGLFDGDKFEFVA